MKDRDVAGLLKEDAGEAKVWQMTSRHELIGHLLSQLDNDLSSCVKDWNSYREEIVGLADGSNTDDESVTLILMHKALLDCVEATYGLNGDSLQKFRNTREAEYNLLLIKESGDAEGMIIPKKYHRVVEREVAAGRISPDNDIRQLAEAGAAVLGDTYEKAHAPNKALGFFSKLLGKK